jgi:adenylate cyclase
VATEIERKFLLPEAPGWLAENPCEEIEQGYLAVLEGRREVRLRRRGGMSLLTVKLGAGETRREEEVELHAAQLEVLWPLTEGARISKRRYRVPHGGRTIEVDVYGADLAGLVVAEVEFGSEQASHEWAPPPWLGRELTGDRRWANESLALHGRPPDGARLEPGS